MGGVSPGTNKPLGKITLDYVRKKFQNRSVNQTGKITSRGEGAADKKKKKNPLMLCKKKSKDHKKLNRAKVRKTMGGKGHFPPAEPKKKKCLANEFRDPNPSQRKCG